VSVGNYTCNGFLEGLVSKLIFEEVKMPVHLINKNFGGIFYSLLESTQKQVLIISPFISYQTANKFSAWLEQTDEEVECTIITRFNREEFIRGASSTKGLERLNKAGARLFALQHLHTKLYIFDQHSVLMGSANFTFSGFFKNHELGLFMENELVFSSQSREYFNHLLTEIKESGDWEITQERIAKETMYIEKAISKRGKLEIEYNNARWGAVLDKEENTKQSDRDYDFKEHFDILEKVLEEIPPDGFKEDHTGNWIKFEGSGINRVSNEMVYLTRKKDMYEYLNRTFYPRQPSSVANGDTVFLAVISQNKEGIDIPMIVGYATAKGFRTDNILKSTDKGYKEWNDHYPYYIEITKGKFLKSPISGGISLIELSNALKHKVYPRTLNNPEISIEDILKRHHRKAHVQITNMAGDYLKSELDKLFILYGYDAVD
jgi:hypothetical protein